MLFYLIYYNSGLLWRPPSSLHTPHLRIMSRYTRSIIPVSVESVLQRRELVRVELPQCRIHKEIFKHFILTCTVPHISLSPAQPKVARPAGLTVLASPRHRLSCKFTITTITYLCHRRCWKWCPCADTHRSHLWRKFLLTRINSSSGIAVISLLILSFSSSNVCGLFWYTLFFRFSESVYKFTNCISVRRTDIGESVSK